MAALFWRGYVSFGSSGPMLNGIPPIATNSGIAYRKFDMNMEFRDRNIWTKPEQVQPNSYIEAGPISNANLICPQGNFTVKGELRGGRIYVPNGTLTIEGGILSSFVAARNVKVMGHVEDSVETGTIINNASVPDARSKLIRIAARSPITEFIPRDFRPPTPEESLRERKRTHDLWVHGQAYRKHLKETIPGVVLPPNPPEPPK